MEVTTEDVRKNRLGHKGGMVIKEKKNEETQLPQVLLGN